jgi:hypothetical protein
MTVTETNRKPADRLADIREQLHVLKAEEESLRQGFIAGTLPPDGDENIVVVERKISERLDLRALRKRVPESVWAPFLISTATSRVTLRKRVKGLRDGGDA